MIRGFYTAASSLVAQQANLNVIANNIANVSTTGFKPQQAGFASLLHENINGGAANTIQVGHGVKLQKTGIHFAQGDLKQTDMPLDFAILGEGFFAVENEEDGTITYTRDGSFQASIDGRRSYLTDASGNYVLDARERRIQLDEDFDCREIGVFEFSNPYGLELVGGNRFLPTEASGDPEDVDEPDIKVGYLENSAVQMAQEMVKMIEASKGFSFGSRIVQAADEMERTINQLR